MKTKLIGMGTTLLLIAVTGCVSLPPLVNVEHKENSSNEAIAKRLDSIDQRLGQLEQKSAQK